jgi:homoserine kinase
MESVKVKCPGTLSNLCCGFDILGLALEEPYDIIELKKTTTTGIRIQHLDAYDLPLDPKQNIAGVALQAMLDQLQSSQGFEIVIEKKIKPGSGVGSSAASAAGVVVAANILLGNPFTKKELVAFAMEGEVLASGSRHADNLAPCIFGGLVLIRDTPSLDIIELNTPPIFISIVHPQIEIKTSYARSILPKEIALKTAITQWANVAGLVSGFLQADYDLISRSLTDVVAEPVRSQLIPGFDSVKQQSMAAGALGGGISGSGPSLFMLSKDRETAEKVSQAMKQVFDNLAIESKAYISGISKNGVEIITS